MSRLPDRTGILISALCTFIAGAIVAAMLVGTVMSIDEPRPNELFEGIFRAFVDAIGVVPTLVVAVALAVVPAIWLAARYRYYRHRVREDRQRAGL